MLESIMEELIAKYPNDFFPRKQLKLKGRQGSFSNVGRYDLLFEDEFGTQIIMELKARPAKYEDATQVAKYYDELRNLGNNNILMHLVATSISPSVREFLDRVGIEYSEIHESEYKRVAERYNETISEPIKQDEYPKVIKNNYQVNRTFMQYNNSSKITPKFKEKWEQLKTFFPNSYEFIADIVHSREGFWLSTSTNAHLYYHNSFLTYISLDITRISMSPIFNGRIGTDTVDRHKLIFPEILKKLTTNQNGNKYEWASFNGNILILKKENPKEFFDSIKSEIIRAHEVLK